MKIYSSKGIILLWSASPLVCDIKLIILVVTALPPLEESEGIRITLRVFGKRQRDGYYFLPTRVIIEANNFQLSRFPKCVLLRTSRQ